MLIQATVNIQLSWMLKERVAWVMQIDEWPTMHYDFHPEPIRATALVCAAKVS